MKLCRVYSVLEILAGHICVALPPFYFLCLFCFSAFTSEPGDCVVFGHGVYRKDPFYCFSGQMSEGSAARLIFEMNGQALVIAG